MVNGGRGHDTSAGWRVRCMQLVWLLEFLLFSVGNATPSIKEYGDPMVTVDDGKAAARTILNSHPAWQKVEVYSTQKDSSFPEAAWGSRSRTGLLSLLRRFVAKFCRATILDNSRPGIDGNLRDVYYREGVKFGSRDTFAQVSSSSSRSRRLLLRRAGYPERRSSAPRYFWALDQQQHQIHREGRRMLQETVSSPALPDTQQVLLGPPAPPDLVRNEKQDWNQDYAEPDVHPPSSN